MSIFYDRIIELAKERGINQKTLASILDISPVTIQNWANGKSPFPQFSVICKSADYFQVSIDYLVGRTDIKNIGQVDMPLTFQEKQLLNYLHGRFSEKQIESFQTVIKGIAEFPKHGLNSTDK